MHFVFLKKKGILVKNLFSSATYIFWSLLLIFVKLDFLLKSVRINKDVLYPYYNNLTIFNYINNFFILTYMIPNNLKRGVFFNASFFNKLYFGYGVEIFLLGVYFRVKFDKKRRLLFFLLGKAVSTIFKVPAKLGIRVYKKRRSIFVNSWRPFEVLNFVSKLESLRVANRYHGKGFHIKGKTRNLKLNLTLKKYK